jgi:glycosyltransferase involved in cell wall biosynthesis
LALKYAKVFLALSAKVAKDLEILKTSKPIFRSELPVFGWFNRPFFDRSAKLKELKWPTEAKVILFFGYIRKYKGLDILIDAFEIAKKSLPELRLIIAGEFYDDPTPYLQQIEQSGFKKDIKVYNQFIPNEEVAMYFDLSDVVVQPYRSATQSGILNMAYGFEKPAVVTRVGGLEEFVDNNITGIIVNEIDPKSVANGILRFYELKTNVDFKSNIIKRVNENGFGKINDTFTAIIDLIKSHK